MAGAKPPRGGVLWVRPDAAEVELAGDKAIALQSRSGVVQFEWSGSDKGDSCLKVELGTQTRIRARLSWLCLVLFLLMSTAQAAHVCGLADELFRPQHGATAQAGNVVSTQTFCAICASSHSPSLAVPLASLPSVDGPCETYIPGRVITRSAPPAFALYIRPPPLSR